MTILIIILRIIHIFGGIFWTGFALFNVGFLQPTVRATGLDGQKTMQYLTQKTRLQPTVYAAATLTVLSGIFLFWFSTGFRQSSISSGKGLVMAIGGLSGIIAWSIAMFVVRGIFGRMGAIGKAIQAQGTPPSTEQTAQMQALVVKLGKASRIAVSFLIIAVLGMAIARYATP